MFEPDYHCECAVEQVGIRIDLLDEAIGAAPLAFLPAAVAPAVRRRQLSYLAGRLCAEHALRRFGVDVRTPLGAGAGGEPLWPAGWTGSISHTNSEAFAVVARKVGRFDIGIDAEPVFDAGALGDVLQVCLSSEERHLIAQFPDSKLAATVFFAAKEAYYKAVYRAVMRFVDFKEVALVSLDLLTGDLRLGPAPDAEKPSDLPFVSGRFAIKDRSIQVVVAPGYATSR